VTPPPTTTTLPSSLNSPPLPSSPITQPSVEQSNNFLTNFFSHAPLPPAVACEVATRYANRFGSSMVQNEAFVPAAAYLAKWAELATSPHRVAMSPISRELMLQGARLSATVLSVALIAWDFSDQDILRFASRPLPSSVADQIVRGPYPPAAKAAALPKASPICRLEVLCAGPDHDATWACLLEVEESTRATREILPLISALLSDATLRSRALYSGNQRIAVAACWTELSDDLIPVAVEFATTAQWYGKAADPVVGLLNQLSLDPLARELLDTHLFREKERTPGNSIYRKGLGRSRLPYGPRVRDRRYDDEIEWLLRAAGRSTRGNIVTREKYVTLPLLYELSLSTHLNIPQRCRLASLIANHVEFRPGSLLARALDRILPDILDFDPEFTLQVPSFRHTTLYEALRDATPPDDVALRTVRRHLNGHQPDVVSYAAPLTVEKTIRDLGYPEFSPLARDLSVDYSTAVSLALVALGSGDTPRSIDAWLIFFGLAEGDPAISLEEVLDTAARLAVAQ
jgi:hypothetical protein